MTTNEQLIDTIHQLEEYKNRLSDILHNMREYGELHSEPALDLHNDLVNLPSIGSIVHKSTTEYFEKNILENVYKQKELCYKASSQEFRYTVMLISRILKNIDTQINNMQSEKVAIKLGQDNQANATGKTKTFSTFSSDSSSCRSPTPSDSGISSDSQNTIQDVRQQQPVVKKKPLGGKKVAPPTVPTNSTTNNPVLSAESPQIIGNTHSEKTPKEKWLSLIDKKCPREKLETDSYVEILKETIRNLRDKVKCAECPVVNFSDVEITSNDKKVLEEIREDFKEEIKKNEKTLKKEEKRIEKFNKSKNSPPKSMFTKLLDLLHLSKGYTR